MNIKAREICSLSLPRQMRSARINYIHLPTFPIPFHHITSQYIDRYETDQIPAPPVTSNVCPDTYDARGDAKLLKKETPPDVSHLLQPRGGELHMCACAKREGVKKTATHKRTEPAASSGVPPRLRGMLGYASGVGSAGR